MLPPNQQEQLVMFRLPRFIWRSASQNDREKLFAKTKSENMLLRPSKIRILKIFLFLIVVLVILVNLGELLKRYIPKAVNNVLTMPILRDDSTFLRVGHMSVDILTSTITFTDPLWVPDPVAAAAAAAAAAAEGEEDEAGDGSYLRGMFPLSVKDHIDKTKDCGSSNTASSSASLCRQFGTHVQLQITESKKENQITCYRIVWTALSKDLIPQNCFEMDDAYWYGGPELPQTKYPIEKGTIPMTPFVPGFDYTVNQNNTSLGPVLERYWVNSQGTGIVIDNSVPLHISMNHKADSKLCFKADYTNSPFLNDQNRFPSLSYSVCKASNVRNIHDYLRKHLFENPSGSPADLLGQPLWTTDECFGSGINQQKFLEYADKIVKYGFTNSQIQLDAYSSSAGDSEVSSSKFPNSNQMISEIRGSKLYVRLKICACTSPQVRHFNEGKQKGYWLMDEKRQKLVMAFSSQEGLVALLDFTNPEAVKWYQEKITEMESAYGVQSFTFDFENIRSLPFRFSTSSPLTNPADYLTKIAEFAYSVDRKAILKAGFQSQKIPVFIEAVAKNATWDYSSGLKNVIPNMFILGILGYPYIVPSAIGGTNTTDSPPASKELFIRWAQMVTYFPIMHFSIPPWYYDEETVKITLNLVKFHQQNIVPLLKHLMKEAEVTGAPMIRPVWWIAPEDPIALRIDCEFLLGDSLLVAPVLDSGASSRNIYLPSGHWKDNLNNRELEGSKWYNDFKVEILQIATFTKLKTI